MPDPSRLSPLEREIVDLLTERLPESLTPTQVAEALGRPLGSVRSTLHRMRKQEAVIRIARGAYTTVLSPAISPSDQLDYSQAITKCTLGMLERAVTGARATYRSQGSVSEKQMSQILNLAVGLKADLAVENAVLKMFESHS